MTEEKAKPIYFGADAPKDAPEKSCAHCGRRGNFRYSVEAVNLRGVGLVYQGAATPREDIEWSQGYFYVGPTCARKLAKQGVTVVELKG